MGQTKEITPEASPLLKLHRMFHFSNLQGHPEFGGVWRTVGLTFCERDPNENKWIIRRVMATGEDQKIGEEKTILEILLTSYCTEVIFQPLSIRQPLRIRSGNNPDPNNRAQTPEQKAIEDALIQDPAAAFLIARAILNTTIPARGEIPGENPATDESRKKELEEVIRDSGILERIQKLQLE
jgi:hypothetical protein